MNIHHWVFKILGKKQSVTDGHTDGRTDNMKTVYPTTNRIIGRYNKIKWEDATFVEVYIIWYQIVPRSQTMVRIYQENQAQKKNLKVMTLHFNVS